MEKSQKTIQLSKFRVDVRIEIGVCLGTLTFTVIYNPSTL